MRSEYTTSYSAIDDRFGFSKKGIFWCKDPKELLHIIIAYAIIVLVTFFIWTFSIMAEPNAASVIYTLLFDLLKLASIIGAPVSVIAITRMIRSGVQYNYTANEEKMLITCPKLDYRADIYYKNVLTVEYKERHRFGKIAGYDVTVYSRDGTFTYRFLFPSKDVKRHPDYTPFRLLEERAGILEKPEFDTGRRIDNAGVL